GELSDADGGAAVPGADRAGHPDEAHHGAGAARHGEVRRLPRRSGGVRDALAREGPGGPLAHGGRAAAGARSTQRDDVPVAPPLGRGGSAGLTVSATGLPGPPQPRRRRRARAAPGAPAAGAGATRARRGSRSRPQDAVELRVLGVGSRRVPAVRRSDGMARVVPVRGGAVGRVRPAADVYETVERGLFVARRVAPAGGARVGRSPARGGGLAAPR